MKLFHEYTYEHAKEYKNVSTEKWEEAYKFQIALKYILGKQLALIFRVLSCIHMTSRLKLTHATNTCQKQQQKQQNILQFHPLKHAPDL